MARVLATGMSGAGKSAALAELERRGSRVVEADSAEWSGWDPEGDGGAGGAGEWLWREDRMAELPAGAEEGVLYVSGCAVTPGG